jgi:dTDP-glucose 4,6-dehydratase
MKPSPREDCFALVAQHPALFGQLQGMRIFLTGGTGFFGSWFLEMATCAADMLGVDFSIEVLSRNPDAFVVSRPHLAMHRAVRLLTGDVTAFAFPDGDFDAVAHFGSTGSKAELNANPDGLFEMIVRGTQRVIALAERSGTQRFLLASTGAVYGHVTSPEPVLLAETQSTAPDTLQPASANAEGKRVAEFLCGCLARRNPRMSLAIARGFAFVGPYLPEGAGFAAVDFIRDFLRGGTIHIAGDGTPYRSYMYGSDLALWLWTLLLRAPIGCQAWNVGSDHALSIQDLARAIAALRNPPASITLARALSAHPTPHSYVPDVRKAHSDFGLKRTVELSEALKRTLAFYDMRNC